MRTTAATFVTSLALLSGCSSESKKDTGPDGTGGSAGAGSGGLGGGAGSIPAGNGGSPAGAAGLGGSGGGAVTCADTEVRCRNACFASVGQVANGCELVARVAGRATTIDALATDGTSLFSVDYADGAYRLVRRDAPNFAPTELATSSGFGRRLKIAHGYVYMNASYVHDNTSESGLLRVPTTGGTLTLVHDPLPNNGDDVLFEVIDDMLYFFGRNVAGLRRVPIAGGTEELVLEGDVSSVVADATDFYYHLSGLDFQIRKSPRDNPTASSLVAGNVISANLFLQASDPANLYDYFSNYFRVPKSGGELELVYDPPFGGFLEGVGPEHLLLSAPVVQPGLYAVTLDGATTVTVDDGDGETAGFVEMASAYFFARDDALFRVAK